MAMMLSDVINSVTPPGEEFALLSGENRESLPRKAMKTNLHHGLLGHQPFGTGQSTVW
jgi:hypothetical protein